jgi:hypothetical protein
VTPHSSLPPLSIPGPAKHVPLNTLPVRESVFVCARVRARERESDYRPFALRCCAAAVGQLLGSGTSALSPPPPLSLSLSPPPPSHSILHLSPPPTVPTPPGTPLKLNTVLYTAPFTSSKPLIIQMTLQTIMRNVRRSIINPLVLHSSISLRSQRLITGR